MGSVGRRKFFLVVTFLDICGYFKNKFTQLRTTLSMNLTTNKIRDVSTHYNPIQLLQHLAYTKVTGCTDEVSAKNNQSLTSNNQGKIVCVDDSDSCITFRI